MKIFSERVVVVIMKSVFDIFWCSMIVEYKIRYDVVNVFKYEFCFCGIRVVVEFVCFFWWNFEFIFLV